MSRTTRALPDRPAIVTRQFDTCVEDDYNDVDTYGARAALRFDINDSWTVTPTVMGQVQKANGDFVYDRTLGELKVSALLPGLRRGPVDAGAR